MCTMDIPSSIVMENFLSLRNHGVRSRACPYLVLHFHNVHMYILESVREEHCTQPKNEDMTKLELTHNLVR